MDVRGIEVTNQLRSAIRAKLLELGVRYDEELPDYILVMVVNKKSRQQMHEDLHLFLEDCTTAFVDWLHDQVLKKLQKVTVAKKKATREFVPTVVVKQEEERRKKKSSDELKIKEEPNDDKLTAKPVNKSKFTVVEPETDKHGVIISETANTSNSLKSSPVVLTKQPAVGELLNWSDHNDGVKEFGTSAKRCLERDEVEPEKTDKRLKIVEQLKEPSASQLSNVDTGEKRLKSCVNKPKITSVVSVKTRLGITSSRNKFEIYRERNDAEEHRKHDDEHRKLTDKRPERRLYELSSRRDVRAKNNDVEIAKKPTDSRIRDKLLIKTSPKNKSLGYNDKFVNSNDKFSPSGVKIRTDNHSSTIRDRLGVSNKMKNKDIADDNERHVKKRLGPVNSKFIALGRLGIAHGMSKLRGKNDDFYRNNIQDDNNSNNDNGNNDGDDDDDDDDDDDEKLKVGPVKSHIIAVKSSASEKNSGKKVDVNDVEEVDDSKAIASKVIVTPRPLKPLQPAQKRATQSLLLRAVAEANQSVVRQKNPEPSLLDKKSALKRLKPSTVRSSPNQNLAVRLSAKKRLVMENIQVELTTSEMSEDETDPYVAQLSTDVDDHMGVVMSLFQRGDDNQKFLVTLNGYNNNITKDRNFSDDEERLEMEINEDDQLVLSNPRGDVFNSNEESPASSEIEQIIKNNTNFENNENHCLDNITMADDIPKKRRKLSPIIYKRSPSPESQNNLQISSLMNMDKRSSTVASIVNDKSNDKCRYWPNCTLGSKCAYVHPAVPCSAFPVCKYGEKCAYKHPKCKFGLSCTKLGCIFSHPSQQCKYHPFCTKPGCSYLHPQITPIVPLDATRSKFTWRRRD